MLAVDAYLQQHRDLLTQADNLDAAIAQLALAAPQQALPAQAKTSFMARVMADAGEEAGQTAPPVVQPIPAPLPAPTIPPAPPATPPVQPRPLDDAPPHPTNPLLRRPSGAASHPPMPIFPTPPPRRIPTWVWGAASALAAMVILALGIGLAAQSSQVAALRSQLAAGSGDVAALNQEVEDLQQQLAAEQAQVATLNQQLGELEQELATEQAQLAVRNDEITALTQEIVNLQQQLSAEQAQLAVLSEADRVIDVAGTEVQPGVNGSFYQSEDSALLTVRGLEPLPPDQTYQFWLIPSDPAAAPVPAGLLGGESATVQTVEIPADAPPFVTIGISIEPAAGSPAPTGPIVALGQQT
jgi:hypothetical protein